MSYRRSRARRNFENSIILVQSELKYLYPTARKANAGSRLLGVYYVYAFSCLEIYTKALISDFVETINSNPPSFDNCPDAMLGYMLHRGESLATHYRRYNQDEDEGAILDDLARTARRIGKWSQGLDKLTSSATVFLEKKTYPSQKNMPQLFRRFGIKDLWAAINKEGRFNSKMILTSLNDIRTAIAHEGRVPADFNMKDFRNRLVHMKKFVTALDRAVATHFCPRIITRTNWNISVAQSLLTHS